MQMCEKDHNLWDTINKRYDKEMGQSSQEPKKLNVYELADLIVQSSEQLEGAILIVDALNETKQSSSLLQILFHMTDRTRCLTILISSTEDLGAQIIAGPFSIALMRKENIASDIDDYIDKRLRNDEMFCHVPGILKQDIKSVLRNRADGTYVTPPSLSRSTSS